MDLLIELAMERENDSHMDKYLRKPPRRETPAEQGPSGRSPQPHSNPGKDRGGQLKHMKETPPCNGKGAPVRHPQPLFHSFLCAMQARGPSFPCAMQAL